MTKETEQARQKLLPAFKAAKKANIKCHFRGEHLVVDGRRYSSKDISKIPDQLQVPPLVRQHTMEKDDFIFFYGKDSPYLIFIKQSLLSVTPTSHHLSSAIRARKQVTSMMMQLNTG